MSEVPHIHTQHIHLDDVTGLDLGLGLTGQGRDVADGVVEGDARGEGGSWNVRSDITCTADVARTARDRLALNLLGVHGGSLSSNRVVTELAEVEEGCSVSDGSDNLGQGHCR